MSKRFVQPAVATAKKRMDLLETLQTKVGCLPSIPHDLRQFINFLVEEQKHIIGALNARRRKHGSKGSIHERGYYAKQLGIA